MRIKHVCEDNYLELDEPTLKMVEEAVSNCMDCSEMGTIVSEKVFTVYDYLQSILSHFAKMLNSNTEIVKSNREEIGHNFFEKLVSDTVDKVNKELKIANNIVFDIKMLDELDGLIDTIGITYDLGNKRGHEIIKTLKEAIEKAEREEEPIKENGFKLSPEGVKWLCDGRIDQLEKRVEDVEKNINNIIGIIDRDRKEHIEIVAAIKKEFSDEVKELKVKTIKIYLDKEDNS